MAAPAILPREAVRCWRFVPRSSPAPSRDDRVRFAHHIEAAVRSGHGLGATPTLVIRSGRELSLTLESPSIGTSTWVERVLVTSYGPGQWVLGTGPRGPRTVRRAIARRSRLPGETPGFRSDNGELVGALALGLATLPPGIVLRCALAPGRLSSEAHWWGGFEAPPPLTYPKRLPGTARGDRIRPAEQSSPSAAELLWSAEMTLEAAPEVPEAVWRTGARAIESGWHLLDGAGVRFLRAGLTLPFTGRFWIGGSELPSLLPGLDDWGRPGPSAGGPGAALGLGRTAAGAVVSVPVEPDQGRHLAVLGETGMGKSSLLVALAVRAAGLGGVVLLDPMGETADSVAEELSGDAGRLLRIAPGEDAPGINALDGIRARGPPDAVRAERRVSDLVHALRRVRSGRYEESSFWGPRLEEMLTRAVRAAAAFPGATLSEAHLLLSTSGVTRQRVPAGAEEAVSELARRMRERPDDADGARRLLHEVVRNPTLEQMVCARAPTLSSADLVAPGRIVLISGRASVVGESTARYLLAVYLALIWSELLASDRPGKTFVLLDEAQWFAHESLGEMLRLARRRNVHVVLATQSVASLPVPVQEAVWTNVADLVVFRGSPAEARELERAVPSVSMDQLLAMPRGEAVAMIGKGNSVQWVRSARIPRPAVGRDRRTDGVGGPSRRSDDLGVDRAPSAAGPVGEVGRPDGRSEDPSEVVAFLRERAGVTAHDGPVRIPLSELRSRFPNAPLVVRQVGAELGRDGTLLRTEHGSLGTSWWLDPHRLADHGAPAPTPRARIPGDPGGAPGDRRSGSAGERMSPGPPAVAELPDPPSSGGTSQPKP